MKKLTKTLGITVLALASLNAFAASPSIDATQSQIKWTGYGVGKSHWGYVNLKEATVDFDKKGEPTKGVVVVDLTSIASKDLENKEYSDKLDGHLKGDDFFQVDKFPTATFASSSITKAKDGSYTLKGKLKIKGIESDETVTLKTLIEGDKTFLTGPLKFDRTKYNVKYNSGKFFSLAKLGDKTIKDEIDLELKLAVKK